MRPELILPHLGKPWVSGARGPDSFDCWGLLVTLYRDAYGIALEPYGGVDAHNTRTVARLLAEGGKSDIWEPLAEPVDGCAVAMSGNARFHHVGMFTDLDGGLIVHAAEGRGVVAESLARLRGFGIHRLAFYRHREQHEQPRAR